MEAIESFLCRLCLITGSKTELLPMCEDLQTKALFCVNIEICYKYESTPLICKLCTSQLENFFFFKKTCIKNDHNFKLGNNDSNNFSKIKDECSDCWQLGVVTNGEEQHKNEIEVEETCLEKPDLKANLSEPKHGKINTTFKRFQCEECGSIFASKAVLIKHIMSHMGLKLYSCDICSKRFSRAEHKRVHIRSHKGIKPYICEICGKTSTKRQDLLRHMLIHSQVKKHECPKCGKRFRRTGDVQSHLRSHNEHRPFSCESCSKSYKSNGSLRKHYRTHCRKKITEK